MVGNRLDHIKLIDEAPAGTHLSQMLGFIDEHGRRSAVSYRPFNRILIIRSGCSRAALTLRWQLPACPWPSSSVELVFNQRFPHCIEKPFEMIPPIEDTRIRRLRLKADHRQMSEIGLQFLSQG